jgi:uncharacterized protein YqjF (DUF2071 family)
MNPLDITEHRPWPLPKGPWIQEQVWNHLLFAHWPLTTAILKPLIPVGLELDTYNGQAWVAVTPLLITDLRFRGLPPLPFASHFPELNFRTYVTDGKKPGVYFFSLDAANRLAVIGARIGYHLPYYNARMSSVENDGRIEFQSHRTDLQGNPAEFSATYSPTSEVYLSEPGSLENWLTERYCLYSDDDSGRLYRAEIHHMQWPLQSAEAEIRDNTVAQAKGLQLPDRSPLLHFANRLDVLVWPLEKLTNE